MQQRTLNTTGTMKNSNANTANNINSVGVNNGIYVNNGSNQVSQTPSNAVLNTEILNYNTESATDNDVKDVDDANRSEQPFNTPQIINEIQAHTNDINTQIQEDETTPQTEMKNGKEQQEEKKEEQCKTNSTLPPSSSLASSIGIAAKAEPGKAQTETSHIVFHKNVDKDDVGYKAVLEGATNPQIMRWVFDSLRTVLLVTFPMFVIGTHPNTMTKLGFPQMMVAAVISTSTHRPTIGEQLGLHSWVWCGVIYMMVTNTVFLSFNIVHHMGAWWGMIALGIFVASLIGHGLLRRFMYIYFFVHMMMIRMEQNFFQMTPLDSAARLGANLMMGTVFGLMANLIPFPSLLATRVDEICFKLFDGTGKLMMAMQKYVWSPDPHAALLFFNDQSSLTKIDEILTHLPALLWFTNWEPLEFPLRNPIRRLKLALLRRIMALMYAAFSTGQTISRLRVEQAERVAMASMRSHVGRRLHKQRHNIVCSKECNEEEMEENREEVENEHCHTNYHHNMVNKEFAQEVEPNNIPKCKNTSSSSLPKAEAVAVAMAEGTSVAGPNMIERAKENLEPDVYLRMREARRELRESAQEHVNAFMPVLMKSMTMLGGPGSTPETLLETVPFDQLIEADTLMRRSIRLDVLQAIHHMDRIVQLRLAKRKAEECKTNTQTDDENTKVNANYCNNSTSSKKQSRNIGDDKESVNANEKMIDDKMAEAQQLITDNEVFIRLYGVYFHLLLNMIAGEIQSFSELMENYKPEHSLPRRLLNYLVIEPWREFRSELINRITLARPFDVRIVKDAIKMTCAYLCACALNFEIWIPPQGTYFFGTTILLGLPVEEESLNMGINRIAGNTLGCALGFLAYHNTGDYAQMIACVLSFVFICQCFKNHPLYGQTFFYASVMTMAGLATSINSMELLVRVLACTYTIVAYMLCCMLIFPTNGIKVLENYRAKLSKVMSEIIDDVALLAHLPLNKHVSNEMNESNDEECNVQERLSELEQNTSSVAHYNNLDLAQPASKTKANNYNYNKNNYVDSIMCQVDVNHMCTQLNVEVELMRELLALCAKWTPFAARELIIRGIQPFPSAASAAIHSIHRRMTGSVQLLVFGMQLLHRPRNEEPNEVIQRVLSSTVASFLNDFARLIRLLFQDSIDSTQCARTWSYPVALSYTSELMRLKVKLHAVLYETFFMLGLPATSTMIDFSSAQIAMLRNERLCKKSYKAMKTNQGKQVTSNKIIQQNNATCHTSQNADIKINTDRREEDVSNTFNNVQKTISNCTTSNKKLECNPAFSAFEYCDVVKTDSNSQRNTRHTAIHEPIDESNMNDEDNSTSRCESSLNEPFHNSFAGINPNMSFAGQILEARRTAAQSTQTHNFPLMRQTSTLLPNVKCSTCRYNNDENAECTNDEDDHNYWNSNSITNNSSSRVNIGMRRQTSNNAFIHTAPLLEAYTAPQDAFPYSVNSVEHDMVHKLQIEQKQKEQYHRKEEIENELRRSFVADRSLNSLHRHHTSLTNTSITNSVHTHIYNNNNISGGDANGQNNEYEMQNNVTKDNRGNSEAEFAPCTRRAVSHLVLVPERGAETSLPTYDGPKFSYREDEVELPEDTDHLALVCIMASCNQLMQEFEKLAAPMNNVSAFQKQLHETSLFLPLITRLSSKIQKLRRDNYAKYHLPPPSLSTSSSSPTLSTRTTLTSTITSSTTSNGKLSCERHNLINKKTPPSKRAHVNTARNPFSDWEF